MRVLFAITKGEVGGAQEHLRILAGGLLQRGHQVGVAVTRPSDLADALAETGAEIFDWRDIQRTPHPTKDLRARRELAGIMQQFHPDVLHLYSSKAGVVGRRLLRRPDGITIFTCHHAPYGPRRRLSHRIIGRVMDQLTLPLLDGIISDGARDMPLLRKLAPKVPIRLVRNAVQVDGPPDGAAPNHVVLWVARLQDPKDPILAIKAWARVVREIPDAELLICGTGPLESTVRAAAQRVAGVQVLGKVADLGVHRARASVFLLATNVEGGITMATLESMAHGLVPIVSDAGDAFLLEHARCGIVVRPGSARALADSIIELLSDPDRIAEMRPRAVRFARDDWTVEDFTNATIGFYEQVLGP